VVLLYDLVGRVHVGADALEELTRIPWAHPVTAQVVLGKWTQVVTVHEL
jgi:hypothetical protein